MSDNESLEYEIVETSYPAPVVIKFDGVIFY